MIRYIYVYKGDKVNHEDLLNTRKVYRKQIMCFENQCWKREFYFYFYWAILFMQFIVQKCSLQYGWTWLGYGNQVTRNACGFLNVSMKRHLKLSWLLSVSAGSEGQRALAHTMHVHPSFPPPDVTAPSDEHNSPCAPHAFGVLHAGLKHPCDVTLHTAACFVWGRLGCIPSERINWRVSDWFIHLSVSAEHILPACAFFVK